MRVTPEGKEYYANDVLGYTQWERPTTVPATQTAHASSSSTSSSSSPASSLSGSGLFVAGNVVQLYAQAGTTTIPAPEQVYVHVVEYGPGAGNIVLFRADKSKTPLRAEGDGSIAFRGPLRSKEVMWRVMDAPGDDRVFLVSVPHTNDYNWGGTLGWCLGLDPMGASFVANAPKESAALVVNLVHSLGAPKRAAKGGGLKPRKGGGGGGGGGWKDKLGAVANAGRFLLGRAKAAILPGSTFLQTGSIVKLTNVETGTELREPLYAHFLGRGNGAGRFFLARTDGSKATLTAMTDGTVHYDGGYEPISQWVAEKADGASSSASPSSGGNAGIHSGVIVGLRNVAGEGLQNVYGRDHWYLGIDPDSGELRGNDSVEMGTGQWRLDILCNVQTRVEKLLKDMPTFSGSVELTKEQKTAFYLDGYLHLEQVVPQELVDGALQVINEALGDPGSWSRNPDHGIWELVGPDRTLGSHPAILALLYGAATHAYTECLLGKGNVNMPRGGQLAVRMPTPGADHDSPTHWHIDGLNKGHHTSFSILVGITLSDQMGPDWGNLVVFPGHHQRMGSKLLGAVLQVSDAAASRSSIPQSSDGVIASAQITENLLPYIREPLTNPVYTQPRAGDVLLVHSKVPHRVNHNHSPHIRYQVYFRVSSKTPIGPGQSTLTLEDVFYGYEGMEDVLQDLR